MTISKLNLVTNLAALLAGRGKSITLADIGCRIQAGGDYRRGPRGNLIRTDLRGQLRCERRRGEISPRQQRIALKASRRGGVA